VHADAPPTPAADPLPAEHLRGQMQVIANAFRRRQR
jgi:hypothetical protein